MTQGLTIPSPSQCEWHAESRHFDATWSVRCTWRSRGPVFKGIATMTDMERIGTRLALQECSDELRQQALREVRNQVLAHRAVTEPIPND